MEIVPYIAEQFSYKMGGFYSLLNDCNTVDETTVIQAGTLTESCQGFDGVPCCKPRQVYPDQERRVVGLIEYALEPGEKCCWCEETGKALKITTNGYICRDCYQIN